MTLSFPDTYTIPYSIDELQVKVVGVYCKAHENEKPHTHKGGMLFHIPVPLTVYCGVTHTALFESTEKGEKIVSLYLPAAKPHYACYEQDYEAVFIEIPKEILKTEKPEWHEEIQQEQCDTLYLTSILKNNVLLAAKCHRFVISQTPLKIGYKESIQALPYYLYHLMPDQEYSFMVEMPTSFYILQFC